MKSKLTAPIFQHRSLAMLLLFLVVTGGFVLYRHADFFVWNDTPALADTRGTEPETWQRVDDLRPIRIADWKRAPAERFIQTLHDSFAVIKGGGYRPLSMVQRNLSHDFSRSRGPIRAQLLLAGCAYGAFAVCMFLLARRFAKHNATALLAVVLMLGAPPLVSSSWLVVAGIQTMVPLMICLALLLYWRVLEVPRFRWLNVMALGLVLLTGPWFREFCGISCLLITFLEIRRARRPTPLMAMAGLFFLHAVFPTALIKWLFFPQLPLLPVTRLGNLGGTMQSPGIHWSMAWQFLPLLPPLLMLLATCNAARLAGQQLWARRPRCWPDWKTDGWQYCTKGIAPIAWLAVVLVLWRFPFPSSGNLSWLIIFQDSEELLGYALCLYIAIAGLQVDLFLVVWFLLSFMPLMRVAMETVHFLYALVPASIILACCMESLWQWAAAQQGLLRGARYALTLALGIIVIDQSLVIYGTYRVMHGQSYSVRAVAAELRQRVPIGSVVVGNVIHGLEIQWAGGEDFRMFFSLPWGVNRPDRVVDDPSKLHQMLVESAARKKVFLLDCDFDYLSPTSPHRNQFVHRYDVDKRSLGTIHVFSATYPFADPLRHLFHRPNVPFLGAPDLVNDFYHGRAIDGCWFMNQVYSEYRLYEVTGTHVVDSGSQLVLQGLHGFDVILCDHKYFGVHESSGAFDPKKVRDQRYAAYFEGTSLEEVKRKIEDSLRTAVSQKPIGRQTH